jgi:FkbM family methyltransferase
MRAAFRDWRSIATKGFLWKHLDLPEREIQIHSRGGARLVAPLVHNVGALYGAVEVFALGAYEYEWELEADPVVLDIGANIGAWVLWLGERRPDLSGTCYEPDPVAAAFLRTNLEMNGLNERVQVRQEAVSARTGTARLFQAQPGEGSSSLEMTSPVARFDRETHVPTVAFDEAIDRIDGEVSLVKMDCEGAEYDILENSSTEAWSRVKRIVLEYHPTHPARREALRRRFVDLDFAVIQEDARSDGIGTLWLARSSA